MSDILGIHHVTAIASDPQRNVDFYTGVLGLRLVKRTVNFDDPQTYHFYYGDEVGTPGSIMTFFPWPGARRGRSGSGQVAITAFAVLPSAIGFWVERLTRHGVQYQSPIRRGPTGPENETVVAFVDPDGLMLEIVGHAGAEARPAWAGAPGISRDHAIHGFHAVTLWLDDSTRSEHLLKNELGFREISEDAATRRYATGDAGPGTIVDLRTVGDFGRGVGGAGTVHHVAFRVADDATQLAVRRAVSQEGLHPTPVIDRNYFHSVYFREPGGVLFELATDPPGFAIDEPVEHLGEALKLPPQYEPHRAEIESVLPPIHLGVPAADASFFAHTTGPEDVSGDALGFVHRYIPPNASGELSGATTLLLLHGTGGDEEDLIPLGQALLPGAGLLSPRGKVLERGAPRFFRRLAEGVFDQEDLAKRTEELAAFVEAATASYHLEPDGIIAVGFSNGANIAASLLLRRPGLLRGAVLLSPMVPFEPEELLRLDGISVFIGAGRHDTIAPPEHAERLAALLRSAGAEVQLHWDPDGHSVTRGELDAARDWIVRCLTSRAGHSVGSR